VRQYPLNDKFKEKIMKQVKQWKQESVIKTASPYLLFNSPLWCTPKFDAKTEEPVEKYRICFDARTINDKIIKEEKFDIPIIEEILKNVIKGKFFTELDLNSAFTQVPVTEATLEILTFTASDQQRYSFVRMLFRISVVPSFYQRVMQALLVNNANVNYLREFISM
jgi:hypothetical protein